jgi:hypothetical protein
MTRPLSNTPIKRVAAHAAPAENGVAVAPHSRQGRRDDDFILTAFVVIDKAMAADLAA